MKKFCKKLTPKALPLSAPDDKAHSRNYRETNDTQFEYVNEQYVLSLGVDLFDDGELNLRKLANDAKSLDLIVNNRDKMASDDVTYLGFEGDSQWYKWGN